MREQTTSPVQSWAVQGSAADDGSVFPMAFPGPLANETNVERIGVHETASFDGRDLKALPDDTKRVLLVAAAGGRRCVQQRA
jgi:hypothetical protein